MLPPAFRESLVVRECNDVYQFLLVLQKKAWFKEQRFTTEVKLQTASSSLAVNCYWDTGEGYQAGVCTAITPTLLPTGKFRFYCDRIPENCKKVRFDPTLDRYCTVSDIHVTTNIANCNIYPLNGVLINGIAVFSNLNPQMEFELPTGTVWFEITASIRFFYGYECGELFSAVQRLHHVKALEEELGTAKQHLIDYQVEISTIQAQIEQLTAQDTVNKKEKNDLLQRISDMNLQIEELQKQSTDLQHENQVLTSEYKTIQSQNTDYQDQINALHFQCATYEKQIAQVRSERSELTAHEQKMSDEILKLKDRLMSAQQHIAILENQYESIANAQFWKMTAPLRKIFGLIESTKAGRLLRKTAWSFLHQGFSETISKIHHYLSRRSINLMPRNAQNDYEAYSVAAFAEAVSADGGTVYDPARALCDETGTKKYVLLISHELNLTGAPIALSNFAESLLNFGYQPILVAPHDDRLRQHFTSENIPVVVYEPIYVSKLVPQNTNLFQFIVINTIVGAPLVSQLNGSNTPVLWWIHEAHVSYHPGALQNMPQDLSRNIHVYCGGTYAERVLKQYRPGYNPKQLLYCVPDYAQKSGESSPDLICADGKTIYAIVGMQEKRKGYDILTQAIRHLPPHVLNECYFVFVGKTSDPEIRTEVVSVLQDYPENTQYFEELDRSELMTLYKQIDCLICASKDDPMPIVVTEAMLMSKIIICSENTGSANILEQFNGGLIYRNNSPNELARCIEFVHHNKGPNLRTLCQRARAAYERYFSQEAFDESIREVSEELMHDTANQLLFDGMVSVVIPVYNAGAEFPTLLQLLKSQIGIGQVEIVIVDSGSCDGSAECAEQMGANVIRILQSEFSHSYARNLGASAANGEYVLFMTQDAMPSGPNWILGLLQPILRGDAVAVSCQEKPRPDSDLLGRCSIWLHSEYMEFFHRIGL